MNMISTSAAASATTPRPLAPDLDISASVFTAAGLLLPHLERGQRIDAATLRAAMESAFGASDATGAWNWKTAYEACEAATVLFLRKYGSALFRKAASPAARLSALTKIASLLPTHTRRSEEAQTFQQFSTPIPLGLIAANAAAITPVDRVLEPSAGTGLLAILAEIAGGSLMLNELADMRVGLLSSLFPAVSVTRFDAAQIDDHLDPAVTPSVVLMNPPLSVMANVDGRVADAAFRHIASALARLAPGGRLVTITGASFAPDSPVWSSAFARLQERGRIVFSAAIDGSVYAKHGTTIDTRLTVIDKLPAEEPNVFPVSPGVASDIATLMGWLGEHLPARLPIDPSFAVPIAAASAPRSVRGYLNRAARSAPTAPMAEPEGLPLAYETIDWEAGEAGRLSDTIYEEYGLQAIRLSGSQAHPTKLVQSAAMASVAPPKPSYRPQLPANVHELLSDAQLETVIYAGEAHSDYLAGSWTIDETFDVVTAAREDATDAVRFRRGFFIGDGTGVGKGRQSAAIILDNWLQGRRRAVWISKSDKLLEDAQRDWSALGMERLLVTPLSRFPQGKPVTLAEGVQFTTYATLRSDDRGERVSRVRQIVQWLGSDFDGVIIFDEAHSMQNAAGGKGERGDVAASQQGRAGLRLQHALPNARIVYVSATGATTVHNLAYAQRLGLWGGEDFPFSTRAEFVEAIEAGGVAAMEVLARDLRALGLYTARSLSFDGVEYELVEHALTPEQTRIYDAYAGAFAVIHNNLDAAMEAANVTGSSGTLNKQAKSAARSAFESAKQRFFGHLLTSMKTPTLIRSISADLDAGHAAVIQIVSTGEALMERRLLALTIELQGILFTAFEQLLNAKIEGAIASGTYDVGLETLTAERFTVTDRQTIYTHPGTGAQTQLLTILQRERNRPVTLDAALEQLDDPRAKLLINERSGRAAVQIPTTSVMLDDGEIERRVRLIRPMEAHNVPVTMMAETHWIEAERDAFAEAWSTEIADVPEYSDSTIHVVTGLLLPIWKRLPNDSTRVYRLQTDEGERIVGRKVSPAWAANATTTGTSSLAPDDAFTALLDGRTILDLAEGLQLRRSRVMGVNRIELTGFDDTKHWATASPSLRSAAK